MVTVSRFEMINFAKVDKVVSICITVLHSANFQKPFSGFLHQFQILFLNPDCIILCLISTKLITGGPVWVYTVPVPSEKPLVVWPNVIL